MPIIEGFGSRKFLPDVENDRGTLGDMGRSLKAGVEQLPGMATGLADIVPALVGGVRPFNAAADAVGEATGFQPGKWAKDTRYSDQYNRSQKDVQQAWEDPATSGLDVAKAYLRNPMYTVNQTIQSAPAMLAGGAVSKGLGLIGRAAGAAGEAGDVAAAVASRPGVIARTVGEEWASPVLGGAGEGLTQAGQAMDDYKGDDARKGAISALGSGTVDMLIAAGGGRLAHRLGLETPETLMAGGRSTGVESQMSRARRVAGGALVEGGVQEFPQSVQEQMWQNYGDGKPLMEGAMRAGIEGGLAGAAMGGAFNFRKQTLPTDPKTPGTPAATASTDILQLGFDNTPNDLVTFPDGSAMRRSEYNATFGDKAKGGLQGPSGVVDAKRQAAIQEMLDSGEIKDVVNKDGTVAITALDQAKQYGYVVPPANEAPDFSALVGNTDPRLGGVQGPSMQQSAAEPTFADLYGGADQPTTQYLQDTAHGKSEQNVYNPYELGRDPLAVQAEQERADATKTLFGDTKPSKPLPIETVRGVTTVKAALADGVIDQATHDELVKNMHDAIGVNDGAALKAAGKNATKAVEKAKADAIKDAQKLAEATAADAETKKNEPPKPVTAKVVETKPAAAAPTTAAATTTPNAGPATAGKGTAAKPTASPVVAKAGANAVPAKPSAPAADKPAPVAPVVPVEASEAAAANKASNTRIGKLAGKTAVLGNSIDFGAMKLLLEPLDARLHNAVRMVLGVDEQGNRVPPISGQAAAEKSGLAKPGKSNTEVSRALNALGITKEIRNRFWASDASVREHANGDIWGTGESNDTDPTGSDKNTESTGDKTVLGADEHDADHEAAENEYVDDRAVIGTAGGSQGDIAAPTRKRLDKHPLFAKPMAEAEGNITRVSHDDLAMMAEVATRHVGNPGNDLAIGAVMQELQRRMRSTEPGVREGAMTAMTEVAKTNVEKRIRDAAKPTLNTDAAPTEGVDGADEGGLGEGTSSEAAKPAAPAVIVRKKRTIVKPEDGTKFSKSSSGGETHTVESLRKSLTDFMNVDSLGRRVKIVASAADLSDVRDLAAYHTGDAMAWTRSGNAYLIADRIPVGQERGVFLHEVGSHLGLDRLLPKGMHEHLANQVRAWAAKNDGSIEFEIAKKALARTEKAGTSAEDLNAEHIAYFIEEAMRMGLNPAAAKPGVKNWFRTLWAAFKVAVRRLGFSQELRANDILNLAHGAARLEVNGNWHGTAAAFKKFNHAFMGSGEGAQAFGWGGYTADSRGIGEGYRKMDTERKAVGPNAEATYDGVKSPALAEAMRSYGWGVKNYGAEWALKRHLADLKSQVTEETGNFKTRMEAKIAELEAMDPSKVKMSKPDGTLLRTDHNARTGEMLHLDDPISGQPANVKAALEKLRDMIEPDLLYEILDNKNADWDELTGKELVRQVLPKLREMDSSIFHGLDGDGSMGADESTTKLLQSLGVKGNRFLDANSRHIHTHEYATEADMGYPATGHFIISKDRNGKIVHTSSETSEERARQGAADRNAREPDPKYNHVIFDDKDMQRVASLPAGDAERVKFSKADTAEASNASTLYDKTADHVRSMMGNNAKDSWATVTDFFRKAGPAFLSNAQLVEQFGAKIKTLGVYRAIQEKMTQERMTQAMKFHNIATNWDKLDKGVKDRLGNVMLRSTLATIHPDEAFTPGQKDTPNGHLEEKDRAQYNTLKSQYMALGTTGQKTYQDAKNALAAQWSDRKAAYNDLVDYIYGQRIEAALARDDDDAAGKLTLERDEAVKEYDKQLTQIKGPYFPLMRFGDFLAIGESAELKALKEQAAAATGEDRRTLEKKLAEMKKDGKHYEVSAHETKGKLNAALREMAAKGLETRSDMQDQRLEGAGTTSQKLLSNIGNVIDATFDAKTAGSLNDAIADVYLRSLPEMHALRQEAHRKGIEGANPDMLRAFSATGQQSAFYISRLKHTKDLTDTMFKMKQEVKGDTNNQHIHREMEKRAALDMQYKETPVQDAIASASWVYHLGFSPSNMLINATQPWTVAAPLMGGRHGIGASLKQLGAAYGDVQKVLMAARFKDGKFDPWSGISAESLGKEQERKAIRELMQRGIVDEGVQHELNMFADDKSRWLAKFNRHMGWANQQIELANRLSTALAAFRLELAKTNDYDTALKYAYDTTLNSQFDYSAEGKARIMREGGGVPMAKLVMQFRAFQQGMLYTLISNAKRAYENPAERKEALGSLAYMTLASGLTAGALGLPFAGTLFLLANAFRDPDDPEGDAETAFRNALFHMTGDRKTADTLAKGIPAAFGIDISNRIGLGDVASLFPMANFNGKKGADQEGKLLAAALGPAAGMGARMYDGLVAAQNGDFGTAVEKTAPKVLADLAKAMRMGTSGMTDTSGDPTGTTMDAMDVAARAAGFSPMSESNYYDGTKAIKNTESAIKARETLIAAKYKEGLRSGDMSEARTAIAKFNTDHPENPINGKKEMEWRKAGTNSGKDRQPGSGVKLGTKSQAYYNRLADFTS